MAPRPDLRMPCPFAAHQYFPHPAQSVCIRYSVVRPSETAPPHPYLSMFIRRRIRCCRCCSPDIPRPDRRHCRPCRFSPSPVLLFLSFPLSSSAVPGSSPSAFAQQRLLASCGLLCRTRAAEKNLAPQLTLLTGLPHCWQLCSNKPIDASAAHDIIKPTNTVKDTGADHVLAVHAYRSNSDV
jgi:hypothetical protein